MFPNDRETTKRCKNEFLLQKKKWPSTARNAGRYFQMLLFHYMDRYQKVYLKPDITVYGSEKAYHNDCQCVCVVIASLHLTGWERFCVSWKGELQH